MKCEAEVMDNWHVSQCSRNGAHGRVGHWLCKQHAKMYDQWDVEGRAASCAQFWWNWEVPK